jgi:hypothetical protein
VLRVLPVDVRSECVLCVFVCNSEQTFLDVHRREENGETKVPGCVNVTNNTLTVKTTFDARVVLKTVPASLHFFVWLSFVLEYSAWPFSASCTISQVSGGASSISVAVSTCKTVKICSTSAM